MGWWQLGVLAIGVACIDTTIEIDQALNGES